VKFVTCTYFSSVQPEQATERVLHIGKFVDVDGISHNLSTAVTTFSQGNIYSRYNVYLLIDLANDYFSTAIRKIKETPMTFRISSFFWGYPPQRYNTIDNKNEIKGHIANKAGSQIKFEFHSSI
jgi:hypothetical protein